MVGKTVLLVISGGIAAFKVLDLIRRLKERGVRVVPVMTPAAVEFVTPLSVAALAGEKVYTDLFDLMDETEMGHIQLSRSADLIVVAPASADILARMAQGRADDLATTLLLATDTPVLVAPAMNVRMWQHPATQRNMATLIDDGISFVGPDDGDMACGEYGPGRLSEVPDILAAIEGHFKPQARPLEGRKMIVTSGPTREPIDPVRYMSNHSSGKQGHAIAAALAAQGAEVTLVSGPVSLSNPAGVKTVAVETAVEMEAAVHAALPAEVVICAAAVADWRMATAADQKLKKTQAGPPSLTMMENPDILAGVSQMATGRPDLVVGFAAETTDVVSYAQAKRARKGCDWILANDVSPQTGVFGGDSNTIYFISETDIDPWPHQSKVQVAQTLAARIVTHLTKQ